MPAITTAILAGTAVAGVGMSGYGLFESHKGQKQQQAAAAQAYQYNLNIAADEQKQEALRMQAMQLDARRSTLQAMRQGQQARAMAVAAATSQGAGFTANGPSSGLSGGIAQVSGYENFNLHGIQNNLELGKENFAINSDITQQKFGLANASSQMAQGQGKAAMGQGFMSLGGSLVSAAGTFANVGTSLFGGGAAGSNPLGANSLGGAGAYYSGR